MLARAVPAVDPRMVVDDQIPEEFSGLVKLFVSAVLVDVCKASEFRNLRICVNSRQNIAFLGEGNP